MTVRSLTWFRWAASVLLFLAAFPSRGAAPAPVGETRARPVPGEAGNGGGEVALANAPTRLGVEGTRFTVNGAATFLLGMSYYGALGAPESTWRQDLDDLRQHAFNWIRIWAVWGGFSTNISAFAPDGSAREPFLGKLKRLIVECDRRGLIVDVTLLRGDARAGPASLHTQEAHLRAVEILVRELKPWQNWYLDLANERDVHDSRHTSFQDLRALRARAAAIDPGRLVTASHGSDLSREDVTNYLDVARVDFLAPHRPRDSNSPAQTGAITRALLEWCRQAGRAVPIHYQEPFRRDYSPWQPVASDFVADLAAARAAGAAGWCLHNGGNRHAPDNQPRRSFDLRDKRLFDQLDTEEFKAVQLLGEQMNSAR